MINRFFRWLAETLRMPFEKEDQLVEDCGMWQMFIEYRCYDPEKGTTDDAAEDERIVYDVICFCGMIDSDGFECLMSQPSARLQGMSQSLLKLHLTRLAGLANAATAAIQKSGMSLESDRDSKAVDQLLEPFEKKYYSRMRKRAYLRLKQYIYASPVFLEYAANIKRCEEQGLNCMSPKQWKRST